ncbi:adenine deaminase C-terminal domain-containing protein [Bacillus sp. FJAT-50079]|uniref:adenine deaminase n=1 Tax=Bacillus sp. FJAT-50079 TaxID=2833577 RepID=UPI001BC95153|nr:adenine deaminase C-terminal domain-containing protein [Bacillus sp. FJAT-50079]MBS4207002.1 adenine deaminase [Bacillus sp. FJAT-50079]
MNVDILVKDVHVYNSYFKKFIKGNVAIVDESFLYIGKRGQETFIAKQVIDGNGKYMVPGLIDIHLHIESTMVTPATFSYGIIKNGTTTIVPEPHEIANVFGIAGMKEMIRASKDCIADMFFAIPSSVPATSMETTGGSIEINDIDELMETENIACLGEIMNFADVISDPDCKTNQILAHVRKRYPNLIIEGHVPRLLDLDLQKIVYAGIDSDHTHQTVEGMEERIAAGMFIEIQEKSMTKEVMEYLMTQQVDEHFCFVTDDVMTDYFVENGHLNHILKKAIEMGMAPEKAIYACTYTPAKRMQLSDRGAIAPGKLADFLLVSHLETFDIEQVYKNGRLVYDAEEPYIQAKKDKQFPTAYYESVKLDPLGKEDFLVPIEYENGLYSCRIINVKDGSTFTRETHEQLRVENGQLCWQESPYGLIATFERYGKNGNRAYGLINGDILKRGAVATTYSHDNHNLLVVGRNEEDMLIAANEVIKNQGGICCVENGQILSMLPLAVGGILSEEPLADVAKQVEHTTNTLKSLGYKHYNIIMSLSTLSLPVSPALKLTDHGLIDVNEGKVRSLIVHE